VADVVREIPGYKRRLIPGILIFGVDSYLDSCLWDGLSFGVYCYLDSYPWYVLS